VSGKKRHQFSPELTREIATGYHSGTMSVKDIEARGISMANVYRWVRKYFPEGARQAEAPDGQTLSKLKQIKRGDNGRYAEADKAAIVAALRRMSIAKVSEATGVTNATLYVWQKEENKGTSPVSESTALVPSNGARHPTATAEVLFNPESTEALLQGLDKMEGFVNFRKAVENKLKKFKAGWIDFDEDDHLLCRAYLQITGGKPQMRGRK
jgi:transposase-like protein